MTAADDFCFEVNAEIKPTHGFGAPGDTPFLDFLREIFQALLPSLLGCLPAAQRNAAGLTRAMHEPNLRQRLGLRFKIARNIDDPRTGNLSVNDIMTAFLNQGKKVTEERAAVMLAQAA